MKKKHNQIMIEENEKWLQNIIETTTAGYFFIDKDGIFRDVNDAWLKMHKYSSRDEILGQHFSLTQLDLDIEEANPIVKALLDGQPVPSGESSRKCRDGSVGYHTFTVHPVVKDECVAGIEGFLIDITPKKQMEEELKQSEIKYKTLVNNIPGMVYRAFPDWSAEIISGSKVICGYTEKELNSKENNWLSIIYHDDIESVYKNGRSLTQTQKDIVQRYRIITKEGNIRWIEDRKTSVFSEGKFIGIDGIVFDVTNQKRAEEEREGLIDKLQKALKEIKTLKGIVPICSHCKKIRDDKGYWNQIEEYVRDHSEADFTHGICPDCAKKMYPDFNIYDE